MKLERLEIRELAGLRGPLVLDELRAPLIAILGPNASGKSSLVRALRALLWPTSMPGRCYLSARLVVQGRAWLVERNGFTSEWRALDGAASAAPSLPPRELADCWLIGLETLVGANASEQGFAREVRKHLSGGFDLDALRASCEPRAQAGRAEAADLKEAQLELHAAQSEHERLEHERRQLGALDARVREAESALSEAEAARLALPVLAARAEIARLERELADLPAGVETLHGDERERHERALGELEQRTRDRLRAALDLQSARGVPALRGLDLEAGAAAELERQATRLAALRTRAVQLEQLERELRQAEAAAAPTAAAGEIEPRSKRLAELEQRLRAARALDPRIDALRAQLGALDDARVDETPAGVRDVPRGFGVALALAGVACLLALAFVDASGLRIAFAVGGGAACAAAAVLLRERAARSWPTGRAAAPEHGLKSALERLEAERARELERAAEIATALGLAHGGSTLELESLAHELRERAQLALQRERAAENARALRVRWQEARAAFAADLAQADAFAASGNEQLRDAAACSAALHAADERARARVRAVAAVEQAEARAQLTLAEETQARRALEAQLAAWGWSELEPAERLRRAALVPRRLELEGALREQRAAERSGLELLRGRGERAQQLLALPVPELDERARAAEQRAQRRDALHAERARLGLELEQASAGHALEEALARVDAARRRLEQRRSATLEQHAAKWLLARVSEQQERETAPAVLREARRLVRAFTRDSIELQLDTRGELEGRELATGRRCALDELSSGTRAQLLLAARIAFAAEQERGEPLPLVFDEALATSDPARFEAVAHALAELARGGRQLFFLTSDPAELARLRAALGGELQCIELADVRGEGALAESAELALEAAVRVPEPGARSAEDYARELGVEALDPWAPPSGAHVFWIASDELELVHALVQRGLERVGQLGSWFEGGGALRGFDESLVQRLRGRARAFARCVELWRGGRARPLSRGELEGALPSGSKLAVPLWEALQSRAGDVQGLLDPEAAREVKGFGPARIAELRAQLEERAWLARGERKDEASIARELALELGEAELAAHELRAWTRLWCAALERGEARRRRELYGAARGSAATESAGASREARERP